MARKPKCLALRSSTTLIVITVAVAVFADLFLYGIVVPVIPTALEARVGLPPDSRQHWTSALLAIYAAGLLAASPIFGFLADHVIHGRRLPLLLGLFAFAAATALLCIGTDLGLWISGRLAQGISAAMVWTVAMALLVDTVPGNRLGRAMGIIGFATSLGILLGPLLGGVLYQQCGYYAVFGVAFGVLGVDLFLRLVIIEKAVAQKWMGEDILMDHQLSEPTQNGSAVHVSRCQPLLVLLCSGRMAAAFYGYFVLASLTTAFDSVLPLFVERLFGWGQTGQGLIFIPIFVPHFLEPCTGMILDRFANSGRFLVAAAFLLMAPLLALLQLVTHDSIGQMVLLSVLLALVGVCVAVALPPLLVEVAYLIDTIQRDNLGIFGQSGATAQGYGLLNAAFAAGSLVGPIWAGMVRDKYGWATMSWSLAILSGFTAVVQFCFLGGRIRLS